MTNDEIIGALKQIKLKRSQIDANRADRMAQEIALNTDYKVDEINGKRDVLARASATTIETLSSEIRALEASIYLAI